MKIKKEIFDEVCQKEGFAITEFSDFSYIEHKKDNRWTIYHYQDKEYVSIEFYDGSGGFECLGTLPSDFQDLYDKIILTQTVKNLNNIKEF